MLVIVANSIVRPALAPVLSILVRSEIKTHANVLVLPDIYIQTHHFQRKFQMITREEIRGRWNEVKGRLLDQWGQLTDDDLQQFRGSTTELIGVIQKKTGATRNEIEAFMSNLVNDGERIGSRVSGAAMQYAEEAGDCAKENYDRVASAANNFSRQVAHSVRSRPAESMAIAFGVGLAAGALLLISRRR